MHAPPPSSDVLAAMRAATRSWHAEAERSGFVARLLAGEATKPAYVLWLRNLWLAYARLEAALDSLDACSPLAPLADPRVYRAAALEADLAALAGPGWRGLPLLPAAMNYAAHVDAAATAGDAGLLAHAYVRYLGDLNGGRVLRRVLARSLGLDAEALQFYAFRDDPVILEAAYRGALHTAGRALDDDAHAAQAAVSAFRLNIALSEAVLDAA